MNWDFTGAEIDVLYKIGKVYPAGIEDGNLPSKTGRNGLVEKGLAFYTTEGFTYLTTFGHLMYKQRLLDFKTSSK